MVPLSSVHQVHSSLSASLLLSRPTRRRSGGAKPSESKEGGGGWGAVMVVRSAGVHCPTRISHRRKESAGVVLGVEDEGWPSEEVEEEVLLPH